MLDIMENFFQTLVVSGKKEKYMKYDHNSNHLKVIFCIQHPEFSGFSTRFNKALFCSKTHSSSLSTCMQLQSNQSHFIPFIR